MPEIALNPPPFNPVWEKGVGGMRGKGAWECSTSPIAPKNSSVVHSAPVVRPRRKPQVRAASGAHAGETPAPPTPRAPVVHSAPVVRPHAPTPRARLTFGVHSAPAAPPRPRPAPAIRRDHSGKRRCRLFPVGGWSAIAERQQLVNRLIDR